MQHLCSKTALSVFLWQRSGFAAGHRAGEELSEGSGHTNPLGAVPRAAGAPGVRGIGSPVTPAHGTDARRWLGRLRGQGRPPPALSAPPPPRRSGHQNRSLAVSEPVSQSAPYKAVTGAGVAPTPLRFARPVYRTERHFKSFQIGSFCRLSDRLMVST